VAKRRGRDHVALTNRGRESFALFVESLLVSADVEGRLQVVLVRRFSSRRRTRYATAEAKSSRRVTGAYKRTRWPVFAMASDSEFAIPSSISMSTCLRRLVIARLRGPGQVKEIVARDADAHGVRVLGDAAPHR